MKITFLGTRGNIDAKNRRHKRHTVTVISYKGTCVAIDWGRDWHNKIHKYNLDAVVITHIHPDHIDGLKDGVPCPVYATKESWLHMNRFAIKEKKIIKPRKPFVIGSLTFEAFLVVHTLSAPAVGYRVSADGVTIFCVHDLISIPQQHKALSGIQLYIGDGASINRPIIRRKDDKLFGHTTIRAQLGWCQKEKVSHAIFTHCGSQIVEGDERTLGALVRELGNQRGVDARISYDGLIITMVRPR
ncbi:MAG: MBL fold metallo-hydrolase [bacterium]|nr:MBL fold metallo-hydrolase [bacterium]